MVDDLNKALEKLESIEEKTKKFEKMLSELVSSEDKKKLLWKEIYENALTDRENAYTLFSDLLQQTAGNSSNHAMFGQVMAKYLERMSKSNDQILRLAELIAKSEAAEAVINPDEIFDKITERWVSYG